MKIGIADSAFRLEERGELERSHFDHSLRIIERVSRGIGQSRPTDLEDVL